MMIELNKTKINVFSKPILENKIEWIEQEIIVPDSMPDAIKVINISAVPFVSNVEVMEGKVKIRGKNKLLHNIFICR